MADWNLPTLTSLYADFLALLKARDEDAVTLGKNGYTNGPIGTIRYNRAANTFEEWNGSTFVPLVISMGSGGLGASNPSEARTALGIGTLGTQNANNVNITGGTVSNLGSLGVNGAASVGSLTSPGNVSAASLNVSGNAAVAGNVNAGTLNAGTSSLGNTTINGNLAATGALTANAHLHGMTAIYAGNPAQLLTVPNGLLDALKLSGLIPVGNLGSGSPNTGTFLRGDGTWQAVPAPLMYKNSQSIKTVANVTAIGNYDVALAGFTNPAKMFWVGASVLTGGNFLDTEQYQGYYWFPSAGILRFQVYSFAGGLKSHQVVGMVLELP